MWDEDFCVMVTNDRRVKLVSGSHERESLWKLAETDAYLHLLQYLQANFSHSSIRESKNMG